MSKVIISLVGGQPMPVYVGMRVAQFSRAILIHSPESKQEATKICKNCGLESKLIEIPAVDYKATSLKAHEILNSLTGNEIYVNVTSGTKPWSVAFAMQSVGRDNVTVFYIDQNNIYRDMTHLDSLDLNLNLDIDTLLKYNNQTGYSHVNLADYSNEDKNVLQKVKTLRKRHTYKFNLLTLEGKDKVWAQQLKNNPTPHKELPYPDSSEVYWDKAKNVVELTISTSSGYRYTTPLHSAHVGDIVFNAGWLEYDVAEMLSHWSQAKEVWMNVKFPYTDGKKRNRCDSEHGQQITVCGMQDPNIRQHRHRQISHSSEELWWNGMQSPISN